MSDYYPNFYLRKRQREQAYRRMTVIVVGLLIFIGIGAVVGYVAFNAFSTRRTPPGATPQLAEQQQKLQTAEQIASSSVPDDVLKQTAAAPPVDLKSVNYSESFPQVDVKLEGADAKPAGDARLRRRRRRILTPTRPRWAVIAMPPATAMQRRLPRTMLRTTTLMLRVTARPRPRLRSRIRIRASAA